MIKDKKSDHKKNVLKSLQQNKHDPKTFWKTIKSATAKVSVQNLLLKRSGLATSAQNMAAIAIVMM